MLVAPQVLCSIANVSGLTADFALCQLIISKSDETETQHLVSTVAMYPIDSRFNETRYAFDFCVTCFVLYSPAPMHSMDYSASMWKFLYNMIACMSNYPLIARVGYICG